MGLEPNKPFSDVKDVSFITHSMYIDLHDNDNNKKDNDNTNNTSNNNNSNDGNSSRTYKKNCSK